MEAKCSFCAMFGDKPHCHNCKVMNNTTRTPQEIDCSLEEFINFINENDVNTITEKYAAGDYKFIELYTGERVKMIILDFDKDKLSNTDGNAKVTIGVMSVDGNFQMNVESTNEGSWGNSKMRNMIIPRYFKTLPEALKNNIKTVVKKTSAGRGSREIIDTEDNLFLFSEIEITGNVRYSRQGEGDTYDYFLKQENRRFDKYLWLRSPYCDGSSYFCYVRDDGSSNYGYASYFSYGVAFGFCL